MSSITANRAARYLRFVVVLALILGVVSVEPLQHYWLLHHPPPGAVPAGLHTGDSGLYRGREPLLPGRTHGKGAVFTVVME